MGENFGQALRRDDVKAIVFTGNKGSCFWCFFLGDIVPCDTIDVWCFDSCTGARGKFSGGFDINAFGQKGNCKK